MTAKITRITAREILDSRGNPTVEATAHAGDTRGNAAVPSGASTGMHEAVELRDGDPKRYGGLGVLKAVENIEHTIAPRLLGMNPGDQATIDRVMIDLDGTPNKSRLGANAILAVSLAVAKLAASIEQQAFHQYLSKGTGHVLPVPLMNVINGGKHSGSGLKIQEFMVIPAGAETFRDALRIGTETYHALKKVIQSKYGKKATDVGDEGGFAPPIDLTAVALELLISAIEEAGYAAGRDVCMGIDPASSEFFKDGEYALDGKQISADQLLDFYLGLVDKFPVRYLEDPFEQEDFDHTAQLTKRIGSRVEVVGDDIFVTNEKRLRKGIEVGAANALLLKVNQVGSLTEAVGAAKLAMNNQYRVVTSHRSGETEDTTIADLAVALNCGRIKTGAPCRSERTAKYNRLLKIESEIGANAIYPSKDFAPA